MKLLLSSILDMLKDKNAGVIGGGAGFALALLLVVFGFFKTLFILFITLVGYLVGVRLFSDKERQSE